MVYLNNTSISKGLNINLEFGRLYLNNLILPEFTEINLNLPKGLVDLELNPSMPKQHFNITQKYGAICLAGAEITDFVSSQNCPSDEE